MKNDEVLEKQEWAELSDAIVEEIQEAYDIDIIDALDAPEVKVPLQKLVDKLYNEGGLSNDSFIYFIEYNEDLVQSIVYAAEQFLEI